MIGGVGIQEVIVILVVALLVFGASRLPKIARSLGQGIREFKRTVKGIDEDDEEEGRSRVRYVTPQPSQMNPLQYPQGQQYTQAPGQPYYTTPPQGQQYTQAPGQQYYTTPPQGQGYTGGPQQQQWTQGPVPPSSGPTQQQGGSPEQPSSNPEQGTPKEG